MDEHPPSPEAVPVLEHVDAYLQIAQEYDCSDLHLPTLAAPRKASGASSSPPHNPIQDVVHRSPDCVATTVPASVCISSRTGMRLRNWTVPSRPLASYTKEVAVFRILA